MTREFRLTPPAIEDLNDQCVEILRVVNGYRDLQALFNDVEQMMTDRPSEIIAG